MCSAAGGVFVLLTVNTDLETEVMHDVSYCGKQKGCFTGLMNELIVDQFSWAASDPAGLGLSGHFVCMNAVTTKTHILSVCTGTGCVARQEKANHKLLLHVPQPSLLVRHGNTISPSFFFVDPVRERHLFYYQQREKSALLETCLFMETIEGWGENGAEEKVPAEFDPLFVVGDELLEAELLFRAWTKYARQMF